MVEQDLLERLLSSGYKVSNVAGENTGRAVICFTFSGMGDPFEGQIYYMITEDESVLEMACRLRVK